MKIWSKTKDFAEGKFLVVRRDGTVPDWPHFVLGARDPAAPAALRAYAQEARAYAMDEDYCSSVEELAIDFRGYREEHRDGNPDKPPHRKDLDPVIRMMRGEMSPVDVFRAVTSLRRQLMFRDEHGHRVQDLQAFRATEKMLTGWHPTHEHYKGGQYLYLGQFLLEGTAEPHVLYEAPGGKVWGRPVKEWEGEVSRPRYRAIEDPAGTPVVQSQPQAIDTGDTVTVTLSKREARALINSSSVAAKGDYVSTTARRVLERALA